MHGALTQVLTTILLTSLMLSLQKRLPKGCRDQGNMVIKLLGAREQMEYKDGNTET